MKAIIAGTRTFAEYKLLRDTCDSLFRVAPATEIVSGGATGADQLGERYAKERGLPIKLFPAKWSEYGKSAGPMRNREMAEYADMLIAFWDGESRGTADMINAARQAGIECYTIRYDK